MTSNPLIKFSIGNYFTKTRSFCLTKSSKGKSKQKMKNLKDKVALVFTTSEEIAEVVAQRSAKAYGTPITFNAVEVLARKIEANGGHAESPVSRINIKIMLTVLLLLMTGLVFAQSRQEAQILALSRTIFRWETTNQLDSLANILDQKFIVVSGAGETQTRDQYLTMLRSGNFEHNNIDVEESIVTVENSTATVVGKGNFTVTISGNKVTLRLSYIEVFIKSRNSWKLLAFHASVLPN
jgi:hypothetical protein